MSNSLNGYCVGCGTNMLPCDDDPNGDKNATCARCRAEEAHDFDRYPGVEFNRQGERANTINGRVSRRIAADDIKHAGRLTDRQIADIPLEMVYQWIRTGEWKAKDFRTWCKALRIE